jgi:putative oxidoreductase
MIDKSTKLVYSLFLLRVSVLLVMVMWTVDKFVNPAHAANIFDKFYAISGLGHQIVIAIAVAEMALLLMFFLGIKKTVSYGLVLCLHGASTLSSFNQYLSPFEGAHLLFFAAWPMLAACITLFLFKDEDTLFQVDRRFS